MPLTMTRKGKIEDADVRYAAGMGPGRGGDGHASGRRGRLARFVRDPRRIVFFALGVLMAYSAFAYESQLNVERPAVLGVDGAASAVARGPARRVVWVLVDGLRLDASREMP